MTKSQIDILDEEVKELRKAKHDCRTQIQILSASHETNKENIEEIKETLKENVKEHKILGETMAVTTEKVNRIDKVLWFVATSSAVLIVEAIIDTFK